MSPSPILGPAPQPARRRPAPAAPRAALHGALRERAVVLGTLMLGVLPLVACAPADRIPNGVLLLSVDSLRHDHVSAYGYRNPARPDLPTTPNVDRLVADAGALFEQAVSTTSWTLPSHLALLTGQPDDVHGVRDLPDRLGSSGPALLAEAFADAGWRTFGIWSGPNLHPWFGFDRGFESYDDCSSTAVADPDDLFGTGGLRDPLIEMHEASHRGVTGEACVEAFERRIAGIGEEERFFAFVHLWDVHYDYEPPPAFDVYFPDPRGYDGPLDGRGCADYGKRFVLGDERFGRRDLDRLISLYDAEIRYTDHNIGRMLARLSALDRLEDTLIVFVADHGEELFDRGGFGHKHTLYDEVLRVPMLMRLDGVIEPGTRVAGQVGLVDVAPTIAELCGLDDFGPTFGRSLVPALVDSADPTRPLPIELTVRPLDVAYRGARTPTWKTLRAAPDKPLKAWDLGADPREEFWRGMPEVDARRDTTLALFEELDGLGALYSTGSADGLPPELRAALEAAGYLVGDEATDG